MTNKHPIQRYRQWYAQLLRLYPKPYRERFGEGMEQTFNDLLRERAEAGRGLSGCAFRMFAETFAGIIRENMNGGAIMQTMSKMIRAWSIVVAFLLITPLVAMQVSTGMGWGVFDFLFIGVLFLGTGLAYDFLSRKADAAAYRIAAGLAVFASLYLVWANSGAGILDGSPATLLYFCVIAVGVAAAFLARFEPRGMSRAMLAMAAAQALVPLIALVIWRIEVSPDRQYFGTPGLSGVFVLTAFFVALFAGSALLFQFAARKRI